MTDQYQLEVARILGQMPTRVAGGVYTPPVYRGIAHSSFPPLLDSGGPLTQRSAFQQELRDYLPVDAPVLRHINVFGDVSGQTGAALRSLRSTDGQEAAVTVTSSTGRSDVWFGIGGTGGYHFNFGNLGDLLFMASGQVVIGYDQWGGVLVVEATDGTNEGGEVVLKGSAANTDWHLDNLSSSFRLHHDSTTYVLLKSDGDFVLETGELTLKERATPSADTDYGKVYTKTDNKLYFQDGAGNEHEVAFV